MQTSNSPKDPMDGANHLTRSETAAYTADMILQLRNISKQANFPLLVYLLEMAYEEAFTLANKKSKP